MTRYATSRRRSAKPCAPRRVEQHDVVDTRRGDRAGRGVEVAAFGDALARRARRATRGTACRRRQRFLRGRTTARNGNACGRARARRPCGPRRSARGRPTRPGPRPNTRHSTGDVSQPDDAVELAPALLGLDELHVEIARVGERLADRVGRDLVEDHAPHRHRGLERLQHVPADGLALAILVSREDELVGALERRLQLGDDLLLVGRHDVTGVEVVVGVDAGQAAVRLLLVVRDLFFAAREVADVPDTRLHRVVATEVARDGLRLRRGLHDHERFRHCFSILFELIRSWAVECVRIGTSGRGP